MANATARNVDFSQVKDGGNFNKKRLPAGDYLATITKIEDAKAKDDTFQYLVSIKINKHSQSIFPYYCKLQENQLWKLRNLLIAAGLTVPKKRIKVDPNRIVGKTIGVTLEDDEYDGKEQSNIAGVFPAAELVDGFSADDVDDSAEDVDDEGEEDSLDDIDDAEVVEDDEEEAEEDPYADLDRTALKAELKKRDASFVAKKSQTDDDLRALLTEADASGSDDAEDEDEEEEAPPAKPAARKPRAKAKPKPAEVSDEELEELDIDDI